MAKKGRKAAPHKKKLNISASPMPLSLSPQLATLASLPPNTDQWLHELKLDGYRIIAFKQGNDVKLMTRNNHNWTSYFINVASEIKKLTINNVILDGEIVLLDENGQSNFQLLQNSIKSHYQKPFIYFVFDILYYDRFNTMSLPLIDRKEILKSIVQNSKISLRFNPYIIGNGKDVFNKMCELGMEGIVSKNINSVYEQKRTRNWVKAKCIKRQEFVIGGYTKPKGGRKYFGSLLIGTYNNKNELTYCGHVGTGFTQQSLDELYEKLQLIKIFSNPFNSIPPDSSKVTWVKPMLLAEVEFTEWTSEGIVRHPSFKGLRMDKSAPEITKEFVTNPNKVLYPKNDITKLDLINYYQAIHQWILPYIINRPLTLVRCPDGHKDCFYQRHMDVKDVSDNIKSIAVKEAKKIDHYIYVNDLKGLLMLVQLGTLEIHPWGSHIDRLEYPDLIVFDIDPSPNVPWSKVVNAAKRIKNHLADYHLRSFVKTTGGERLACGYSD